ncbi:Isoeugenol synthase 1, partial [Sarracenia purpurea var. burkii]
MDDLILMVGFWWAAAFTYEEDVAAYTVKAATDERTCNRVIIYRAPQNVASQLELVSAWEKKTGRTLTRIHVPEEEIVKLSK